MSSYSSDSSSDSDSLSSPNIEYAVNDDEDIKVSILLDKLIATQNFKDDIKLVSKTLKKKEPRVFAPFTSFASLEVTVRELNNIVSNMKKA